MIEHEEIDLYNFFIVFGVEDKQKCCLEYEFAFVFGVVFGNLVVMSGSVLYAV